MSAEPDQPLAHALQTEAPARVSRGVEAAAVVSDTQGDGIFGVDQVHLSVPGSAVPGDVCQRLLGDTEERLFYLQRHPTLAPDPKICPDLSPFRPADDVLAERRREAFPFQGRGRISWIRTLSSFWAWRTSSSAWERWDSAEPTSFSIRARAAAIWSEVAKTCCLTESCRSRAKRLRASSVASSPLAWSKFSSSAAMLLSSRESWPSSSLERSFVVAEKSPLLHDRDARTSRPMRRVRLQAVKKPKSAPRKAAGTARKIAPIPTVMRSGAVRFGSRSVPTRTPATRPFLPSMGVTVTTWPSTLEESWPEFSSPSNAALTSGSRPEMLPASNRLPSGKPRISGTETSRRRLSSTTRRAPWFAA